MPRHAAATHGGGRPLLGLSAVWVVVACAACARPPAPHADDGNPVHSATGHAERVTAAAIHAAAALPGQPSPTAAPSSATLRADRGQPGAPLLTDADVPQAIVRARAVVWGDSGTGSADQYAIAAVVAAQCRALGCDFGLHTGDIIYPAGIATPDDPLLRTHLEEPYAALPFPIWLALGNHDHYGNEDAWVTYAARRSDGRFRMPAKYYTFLAGGVRFVALDTEVPDAAQEAWALQVLAASQAAREPWVIAFGHHPRWSAGQHGDADASLAAWLDRVLCGHVDLYLAGHDHDRQVLRPACGVVYAVSGAGAQVRPMSAGARSLFAADTMGFAHLDIAGPRLRLRMFDERGTVDFGVTVVRARDP